MLLVSSAGNRCFSIAAGHSGIGRARFGHAAGSISVTVPVFDTLAEFLNRNKQQ
jgi:hypothetical protein